MKERDNRITNFGFICVIEITVIAFQILNKFMYSRFLIVIYREIKIAS